MHERERSIWAWGWRDKFPDAAARAGLVQLARVLLPRAEPAIRALPPDEPVVPDARLTAISGFDQTPRARAMHARGRAFPDLVAGFAGDYAAAPELIARPRTAEDVARVLEQCDARGWACVPFGGGTSVVGGVD